MKVLVINCGSSSIKYQLLEMDNETALAKGLLERIGIPGSRLKHKKGADKYEINRDVANHKEGLNLIISTLIDEKMGVIRDTSEIDAVGHRVVHGGELFASSVRITDRVIKEIEANAFLAPLHNPPNIQGIKATMELLPGVPQVAVFDTAFHQSMDSKAYLYAIPYEYYEKYKIRRYGFHGTSHRYVAARTAVILKKPLEELKIITVHIGNGASIAAVKHGKSIDTSMGFTPLEGLIMGTRSGDIDPAIVPFLQEQEGLSPKEITEILNKKSGVLGLTRGQYSDMREIEDGAIAGDPICKLAHDIYEYRIAKYIGAYAAAMNGVDAISFTAGVGENSPYLRKNVVTKYLGYLGITLDEKENDCKACEKIISTHDSTVKVLIVPTNEELVIARDTKEIVEKNLNELKLW
ncbi:acetate/propionate family kinase [Kosmotoga pacifica]|uniref:Acetate kinase n=1 Tax=Kosmotoga pacifica TaxID=1330330 RepID=A0A0G2ZBL7_9BACT|nr:acetate kinase [Kosmotoga pacifica]AKI96939.1 acetate kinase [Kosmotoga pacifica]